MGRSLVDVSTPKFEGEHPPVFERRGLAVRRPPRSWLPGFQVRWVSFLVHFVDAASADPDGLSGAEASSLVPERQRPPAIDNE